MPFTRQVAQLSAEEFVSQLLVGRLGARAVAVGENFRFGRGHAGNVHLLEGWGSKYGFQMEIVRAVSWRGRVVSSTGIRQLLLAGRVSLAGRHLLRPYRLEGEVVSGRGIGSRQTVPTLNLATRAEVVPAGGVYVTRTLDPAGRRAWDSITNIGFRPTFGPGGQSTIETFLLDPFDGDTPRSDPGGLPVAAAPGGAVSLAGGAEGANPERRRRRAEVLPPRQGLDRAPRDAGVRIACIPPPSYSARCRSY